MGRLRVAIACRQVAGVTGTTTGVLEHARRMSALGWDVHLYGETLDLDRVQEAGATAHRVLRLPLLRRPRRRFFAWRVDRATARGGYDMVIGHGDTFRQDVLALHNCVHLAHEFIHETTLPSDSSVGAIHERILRGRAFRGLIANSRLMAEDLSRRFGLGSDRVRVIYPGHDPKRFDAADRERLGRPFRARLGASPDDVIVGLITSGDFQKRGVSLFLKSLARLSVSAKARARALVVGQETRLASYLELARATGFGDRLTFLPPDPEVAPYLHSLDVYAFPAAIEEFGQSVQEAMACGVPVLTSGRVGAAELLPAEARAMLLHAPEELAFASRLEELIDNTDLRRRWGDQGQAAVRANTWDENFRKTRAYLEELGLPR